ncbi:hypothetical protein Tco_1336315 [Tanacetum coccineum]
MSMMGEPKFFLGLQVHQSRGGIFISQSQYAIELLKKHGLDEYVSMSTPMATERLDADLQGTPTDQTTYRRMIGGIMYLTASRLDIAFATFVCARYQACPTVKHLKEVKRIFWYLRQSYNMGLWYPKDSGFELIAYSDVDHAGCKDDSEYLSLSACCAQIIWMRTQLLDYGYKYNRIPMYCDSKSAIAISCNPVQHSKTKHIDIRYHFIKEHVEKVIIMAQQQHAADVHPDELCPPNKRYDLMDANKKVDLDHVQCPSESKILTNIIKNHPLRFSIAASSSVPWIYMAQFWHTLKEDGSKYRLRFMLDKKELTLTLDDFRQIFHLPQATANNHNSFVPPPSFSDMVPFYKHLLGFTNGGKKTQSNFRLLVLLHHCKPLSKYSPNALQQVTLPTESTQGTHRTPSAPRSPNPDKEVAESSAPRRSTVIRLRIPERRSTRLTPPAPVPTVDKADEMILQDTLQVSLAEHKSREEQEARENVALVDEHDWLLKKLKRWIEPRSDKESPEVEIAKEKEVEISKEKEVELTNVVIPVNVNDEDEEITDEVYELKRREKGKIVGGELMNSQSPHQLDLLGFILISFMPRKSFDTLADNLYDVMVETLPAMVDKHINEQVVKQVPEQVRNQVPVYIAEGLILERQKAKEEIERLIAKAILQELDASIRSYMSGHILHVHPAQSQTSSVPEQQYQLYLAMKANPQLQQQDIAIWLALQMKFERNTVLQTACRTPVVRLRDQDDPHDDAHPEGENSAKRQKTSEYEAYVSRESSSGQVFQEEQAPSTSGNQKQNDDFDFWTDSYASDDDEIPSKQVSQEIIEEVSLTIDEAKLRKMTDEMKEILVSSHLRKTTPLVHSCQRDPEAPVLSLINQDLLYLKKGNSGPEKINPHAKIFYIRKQKEPGKSKEEIYSNSKIVQVIKTYWELGHAHKFITEIVARRVNDCIVSITEPDYKNLNKNDIEDIYLLIMNGKVPDYADTGLLWSLSVFIRSTVIWERVHNFQLGIESYQQKVNLTAPTMTFPVIEDHEMFSIIYEPVHGFIYKNSKKEKRVMRHVTTREFPTMVCLLCERLQRSIQAIQIVCSPSSQILALESLAFNLGPMGLEGIAKVAIAVYKVGFEESDGE